MIAGGIQYGLSSLLVSAECTGVAEDDVCGSFLNICRYLNRHHQRSFAEQNVCSVHIY